MLVSCLEKAKLSNYRLWSKLYFSKETELCHTYFFIYSLATVHGTLILQVQKPSLAVVSLHSAKDGEGEKVKSFEKCFFSLCPLCEDDKGIRSGQGMSLE